MELREGDVNLINNLLNKAKLKSVAESCSRKAHIDRKSGMWKQKAIRILKVAGLSKPQGGFGLWKRDRRI